MVPVNFDFFHSKNSQYTTLNKADSDPIFACYTLIVYFLSLVQPADDINTQGDFFR